MPKKPEQKGPVRIDETAAMQYINDNFNLSGEAGRMCAALFGFAAHNGEIAEGLVLSVLDSIGFDQSDLDRMSAKGIVSRQPRDSRDA